MAENLFAGEMPLRIPEDCKFWEKDNPNYKLLNSSVYDESNALVIKGIEQIIRGDSLEEELRTSEYFFNDQGLAIAFRRIHSKNTVKKRHVESPNSVVPQTYCTVYPHPEFNTYFRWSLLPNEEAGDGFYRLIQRDDDCPQIWFGRLQVDHGSAKQQDEMNQSMGGLSYRRNELHSLSLGANFLSMGDKSYPNPGRPYFDLSGLLNGNVNLKLWGAPTGYHLERVSSLITSIVDPKDEPVFNIGLSFQDQIVKVEQTHLASGARKIIRAHLTINAPRAGTNGVPKLSYQSDLRTAIDPLLEMAREIGCTMGIGGPTAQLLRE